MHICITIDFVLGLKPQNRENSDFVCWVMTKTNLVCLSHFILIFNDIAVYNFDFCCCFWKLFCVFFSVDWHMLFKMLFKVTPVVTGFWKSMPHHAHIPFNGHFPGKPGLASCCLDSLSPVSFIVSILKKQTKTLCTHSVLLLYRTHWL